MSFMARPVVFISSTFFDLKQVRADLERFIHDLGYNSVLNERGQIPYGSDQKLEEYCYREISQVDILVAIIGGRFGSESQHANYSITQMEIKTAHSLGKQIYVFVDKSVFAEYQTYKVNKGNTTIRFASVNDIRVFEFIEHLEALKNNNTIHGFETADDITKFLREQWAGLFQRFLEDSVKEKEQEKIRDLQATARTLQELVAALSAEMKGRDGAFRDILLSNHPAMEDVRRVLKIKHRVYFTTLNELVSLIDAYGYRPVDEAQWDDINVREWMKRNTNAKKTFLLYVPTDIFDEEGRLRSATLADWRPGRIRLEEILDGSGDDDIPF